MPGGRGSTVGIASLEQIGRRVTERLRTLEVKVIAHDPFAEASLFGRLGAAPCSFEALFAGADVISLRTPLLPETRGMVCAGLLALMRPNATLINTARLELNAAAWGM